MQTNLHSLHHRLDRLGANEGPSIAVASNGPNERMRPDKPHGLRAAVRMRPAILAHHRTGHFHRFHPMPPTDAAGYGAWGPTAGRA